MRRSAAAAASVTAVLLALAAVVLASRGRAGDRTAAAYDATSARNVVLALVAVALLASTALAVWALWPEGRGEPKPPPRARLLPSLLLLGLVLAIAVFAPERSERSASEEDPAAELVPADEGAREGTDDGFTGRASPRASLLLVATASLALLAATALVRRRAGAAAAADDVDDTGATGSASSRAAPVLPEGMRAGIMAGGLESAVAAVRAEADPRTAVLLAYAVLDAHLAGTPAARPTAATPHEWLRRIRAVHPAPGHAVPDVATRLTGLYERARFSVAPMTGDHREEAATALARLPRPVRA